MDPTQLDELIAQVKSLAELTQALTEATEALDTTPPAENKFTREELDAVLAEVDKLKTALEALVPTEEPTV